MSMNFGNDMGPEAEEMIRELLQVVDMDRKTAIFDRMDQMLTQKQMGDIARAAKQPATLEINKIGDRKEVGGVVYELDEKGWRRLPIGTTL